MSEAPADPSDVPEVGELLDLIGRLDADNERLRLRVLEVMEWMEEAVTAQVATERELESCRRLADEATGELEAIRHTRSWRLLAVPRRAYGALRHRFGRGAR